jgi:hypothetical protein
VPWWVIVKTQDKSIHVKYFLFKLTVYSDDGQGWPKQIKAKLLITHVELVIFLPVFHVLRDVTSQDGVCKDITRKPGRGGGGTL